MKKKIDTLLKDVPPGTITYEDASMSLIGFDVTINDIKLNSNGKSVAIDEIVINDIDRDHKIPQYMDVEVNGIDGDIEAFKIDRQSAQLIDMLGLKEVVADIGFEYDFDKENKTLKVEELSMKIKDLAKLSFETELHGINSLLALPNQMQSAKVASASLEYKNYADKELITSIIAMQSNSSYEKAKENMLKEISSSMKKEKDDNIRNMSEQAHEFFEDPEKIELSISPKEPVSFMDIMVGGNPEESIKLLNFESSVN